ncbi:MAG: pirin family protein, partial [Thermodesulfobacteriota bacterium]
MSLSILHRDDLPLGGFAGLKEHRLVTDSKVFGGYSATGAWAGIGNFVYLADARFNPGGETHLHDHEEVDVISVMVEGRIIHEGTLEHGEEIKAPHVQVQCAGGEGFSHNEINPDDTKNRMIQIWVLPEKKGEPSAYKIYNPQPGNITRVYGGGAEQSETFSSRTVIDVAHPGNGEEVA